MTTFNKTECADLANAVRYLIDYVDEYKNTSCHKYCDEWYEAENEGVRLCNILEKLEAPQ